MSTDFFQDGPQLGNQYSSDEVLRGYLRRKLPPDVLAAIEPDLQRLGARAAGELRELAEQAEAQPPRLVPYDPWGRRVDHIEVSGAWQALDRVAAEEGLIATGYERKQGEWSRTYQLAKLYLFHPSSAIYSCPLAMTDGAARAIELYGDAEMKSRAFGHLTSRDPARFWTSGQWMTERTGGSDVSGTSTVARPVAGGAAGTSGGEYTLHGAKWFTSATTAQMAMTLARIEGDEPGSRGLSLFYLELRDGAGKLNGIQVHRLKDKLGTKALPTAELTLDGTHARLVGGRGNGVKKISSLFNITRIYNSVCAVGYLRRGIALARDYAHRRRAFGALLSDHPLHRETLAELEVELRGAVQLVFRLIELLGKEETGRASAAESALLRLLTPVAKLYTAKQAVRGASEVLECFGGAGYVEDTGLPRLLRDAQVLSIWEGTTNVLSLDTLRAIDKEAALPPFFADVRERLGTVRAPELAGGVARVTEALGKLERYFGGGTGASASVSTSTSGAPGGAVGSDPVAMGAGARGMAYALARTYTASLLLDQAQWELGQGARAGSAGGAPAGLAAGAQASVAAALRWCAQDLTPLVVATAAHRADTQVLSGASWIG